MTTTRLLLPAPVLVLFVSACHNYVEPAFNKPLGANGAALLVVPFQESALHRSYGESRNGATVAAAVKSWAAENADDPVIVEGELVDDVLKQIEDWNRSGRVSAKDWAQVAGGLGARYVLEGDLKSISTRDPKLVGLFRARVVADYRVVNIEKGLVSFERKNRTIELGGSADDPGELRFSPDLGAEPDGFRAQALQRLGEAIARDLYGYTE